ncbi:MAG: alpha-ketoacid dehydrogenase subunit beta [Actinobacteria bacterium]|nr:alpha-ketoacid dehydrogenase subunit beta [Actinomycetota bacterium]
MREITYSEALREAIRSAMAKDDKVIMIGEEIGQGYAGVFGVSKGLYDEFGPKRIIDTPIAENSIMGAAIGASLLGFKPIVEVMFADFIAVCFDGILNQAAKVRFMSNGQYSLNLVVRLPGGEGSGTGPHHSQCLESLFMAIPGLKIANPSNPYDAKGLMSSAIYANDPVLFFEHKKLYKTKGDVPQEDYAIPFGKAGIARAGKDITIVAHSYMVSVALAAADELYEKHNIDAEVIDPKTLVPLDMQTIAESVKKTSRLAVVEETYLRAGVGSEIGSIVSERYMDWLDCPIKKIASRNVPIPMPASLVGEVIPDKKRVVKEIREMF